MTKSQDKETQEANEPEIKNELSKVASSRQKSFAILAVAVVILSYVAYTLIFPSDGNQSKEPEPKQVAPTNVVKPESQNIPVVPQIPSLPEVPKLLAPNSITPPPPVIKDPTPPTAPPTPQVDNLPVNKLPTIDKNAAEKADKKRKSSIMLINNPPPKPVVTPDEAEQLEAFKPRSNLKYLLSKGKIIDVILETAINTDAPGEIRGVVSRDVFAEDGETRLIPKGSKIFGTFKNTVDDIYGIIAIEWNRIDLASGYSLKFAGTSVDNLGRSGVQGRLDNKYKEKITSQVLSSAINIGLAQVLDKIIVPGTNTVDATKNQLLSQSLSNLSATTASAPNKDQALINTTCSQALMLFKDTTMQAYKDLNTQCQTFIAKPADPDGTYTSTFTALISALQTASTAVATSNVTQSSSNLTPTQTAVQTAVKDLSGSVKDMLTSKQYTPNVTINQGELIRVYVNKDYLFPRNALGDFNIIQ
jgi:type IV secretion system protein VirB10